MYTSSIKQQGYKVEFKRFTCEANLICNAQTLKEKKLFFVRSHTPVFSFPFDEQFNSAGFVSKARTRLITQWSYHKISFQAFQKVPRINGLLLPSLLLFTKAFLSCALEIHQHSASNVSHLPAVNNRV